MTATHDIAASQRQFEKLFHRSRRRAFSLAYRLTGNAADAEDVTQDAYVRAWNRFDHYNPDCPFEAWLFRIVTNRAIDMRRHKKRIRMLALDAPLFEEEGDPISHEFADPSGDPQAIVLSAMLDDGLQRALAALPKDYRTAIMLCNEQQYSYQEIADTMNCAVGTVRSRIHRGRQIVRRTLEGRVPGQEQPRVRRDTCIRQDST